MRIEQGRSFEIDAKKAVDEATRGWREAPDMVFVFCSTKQNASDTSAALAARFPNSPIAGCTTAGELLGGEHSNESLVVAALYDTPLRWAVRLVEGVKDLDQARADEAVNDLFAQLGVEREAFEADDYFSLLMIDGLSMSEERVSAMLAEALDGIPLAGGSAGDDLAFGRTFVISDRGAMSDAAIVVLAAKGGADVKVLKHQHFVTTPTLLCITKADSQTRTVYEMDGYPAAEAYARALGKNRADLTDELTFLNPVTFSCDGQIYVRSIQKVNDDGSIVFYCGIEEGMVLEVGSHEDMQEVFARDFGALSDEMGKADFVLGFNCILRALEANTANAHDGLGHVMSRCSRSMIGFDTYGEQLNGLHINQTLVAVAIRAPGGRHASA